MISTSPSSTPNEYVTRNRKPTTVYHRTKRRVNTGFFERKPTTSHLQGPELALYSRDTHRSKHGFLQRYRASAMLYIQ